MGLETVTTLDRYDLLAETITVTQATWAHTEVVNDYRVLAPVEVTDPNGRQAAVRHDELGQVVASAVLGPGGDTLDDPTISFEYDVWNWYLHGKPTYSYRRAREEHGAGNTRFLESYSYHTGSGGVAVTTTLTSPGPVDGAPVDPRWLVSGHSVVNNKGNPVKTYEPHFATTAEYVLTEHGRTSVRYYDALGRNLRTDFPDGTFSRVEFGPWRQRIFDANDTVLESSWYTDRGSPNPVNDPEPVGDPSRRAAWLAAAHADTPVELHFDTLRRPVYTITDYGGGVSGKVRIAADLTGRFTDGWDALGRHITTSFAAQSGLALRSWSAEKGTRRILTDVTGATLRVWDERGTFFDTLYDELRRAVGLTVTTPAGTRCLQYVIFGDRHPDAATLGLYGVTHLLFDTAGRVEVDTVDFKGNPTAATRALCGGYTDRPDWSGVAAATTYADAVQAADAQLNLAETFTTGAEFDALNRPTRVTLPDRTVLTPTYRAGGELGKLQARVRGTGPVTDFLQQQEYDARGQRQSATYGNGVLTSYFYDPETFRLERLLTAGVQDRNYTYDPSGNITNVVDPRIVDFYGGAAVPAASSYTYDAAYQLVKATGRELSGMPNDAARDDGDLPSVPAAPAPTDTNAVRSYTEEYSYDLAGNLLTMAHRFRTQAGVGAGWTRTYDYGYQTDPADATNRMLGTGYGYDPNGNMNAMPHLSTMDWSEFEQLSHANLGGGGDVYYAYGSGGARVRKVIDRPGSLQLEWIFLGAVTLFRRRNRVTAKLQLERWTVEISDDTGPIAQADTKTVDDGGFDPANPLGVTLVRYRHTDHLGSSVAETDAGGTVISYEEYHPYGTTAYRYGKPGAGLSLKRYRFAGHQRDDETGFYYAGARYYASWLGRWVSTDPTGFGDGPNLYSYCHNSPIRLTDPNGTAGTDTVDLSIESPNFTGREAPTVGDFRQMMPGVDPRVSDKNSTITYVPNPLLLDPETHSGTRAPGGTWVLHSVLPAAPAQRSPQQPPAAAPPPPAPPPPPPPDPTPAPAPAEPTGTTSTFGSAVGNLFPGLEKFIWNHPFSGPRGTFRGNILEWMYGVPWRDNKKGYDVATATEALQVKSTDQLDKVGNVTRAATRDAAAAVKTNKGGLLTGRSPRPVVITPSDVPKSVGQDIKTALEAGKGRKIPAGALPPEHIRGLPGGWGAAGKFLTGVGFLLSAWSLKGDWHRDDWAMGSGDALSAAGGGLEIYAILAGGTIAMYAGLALGGVGIAVTSGVSAWRAHEAHDTEGTAVGLIGVVAGSMIAVGAGLIAAAALGLIATVACAPAILAIGLVLALGVGAFHLYRYFKNR